MAINKTVNKSTKSHGAMRNCIEYVLREEKVRDGLCIVTGPFDADSITYDNVYRAFLDEKKIWDKDSGRMYAHNIISFHKDEQITPEQALDFGIRFADKWFDGFQTLVAVHQDKDHIHIHMVTNSVSYLDGHKLHNTRNDLQRMKDLANQMCLEQGLTIVEKGHHFDGSLMDEYDITAWSKDKYNLINNTPAKSYVAECAMAISDVLDRGCLSRDQFISDMSEHGWSVKWTDDRKNITFEDTERHKVRDTNLSKTFNISIGKEALDAEFIRQNELRRKREEQLRLERERSAESDQLDRYYAQIESAIAGIDNADAVRDDTDSFLRKLESQERASEEKREDSVLERQDRDSEWRRLSAEREREAREVERAVEAERKRGQSRSLWSGPSL